VIKYLGSKRRLVGDIVDHVRDVAGARTVLDLFSGTSRVGMALKQAGYRVHANDHNAYAATLSRAYVEADREDVHEEAVRVLRELNALPGAPGWFTETYSVASRYVQEKNGARIDAIREWIAARSLEPALEAVVLTSLLEAADRVDSTVGVQMSFLKEWSRRSHKDLELRVPDLLPCAAAGKGRSHRMEALDAARSLEGDVAYLDPPYNQHSFLGNYHVWESLVTWDKPEVYGTARKRVDCRSRRSPFNRRGEAAAALRAVVHAVRAPVLLLSFSDDGFLARSEVEAILAERGPFEVHARAQPRYVGAKIGIYSPQGERVGTPGRLETTELLYVCRAESPPRAG
jgi:adenine-specific DNA-methyltransferase